MNTIANTLLGAAGASTPNDYAPPRAGELLRSCLDTTKAQQMLDWKPTVTLQDGLARTFRFFADRRQAPISAGSLA